MNLTNEIEYTTLRLQKEAQKYLVPEQLSVLEIALEISFSCLKDISSFTNSFYLQSLKVTLDLAKLRLEIPYLLSAILYYPIRSKALSFQHIENLHKSIVNIIRNLLELHKFEINRWNAENVQKRREKKTTGKVERKKGFWKKQTDEATIRAILRVANDTKVALIMILERLYILKYSESHLDPSILLGMAEETLVVHAIIAEILGIWFVKWQLDDMAFKIIDREMYTKISRELDEGRTEREKIIQNVIWGIKNDLEKVGVMAIKITGRPKHIYGLYRKIKEQHLSIQEINDNLAIRIIVESERECYEVLSILLDFFEYTEEIYDGKPYRDWIEKPKPNGYQSIHTTVYYPISQDDIRLLEIQIRTEEMHEKAEYGIAAHWVYRMAGNTLKRQRKYHRDIQDVDIVNVRKAFEAHLDLHKGKNNK